MPTLPTASCQLSVSVSVHVSVVSLLSLSEITTNKSFTIVDRIVVSWCRSISVQASGTSFALAQPTGFAVVVIGWANSAGCARGAAGLGASDPLAQGLVEGLAIRRRGLRAFTPRQIGAKLRAARDTSKGPWKVVDFVACVGAGAARERNSPQLHGPIPNVDPAAPTARAADKRARLERHRAISQKYPSSVCFRGTVLEQYAFKDGVSIVLENTAAIFRGSSTVQNQQSSELHHD